MFLISPETFQSYRQKWVRRELWLVLTYKNIFQISRHSLLLKMFLMEETPWKHYKHITCTNFMANGMILNVISLLEEEKGGEKKNLCADISMLRVLNLAMY